MFALRKLFGKSSAPSPSRPRRSSFRPLLETLEDRQVPSSSGVISSITDALGHTAVFAIGSDGNIYVAEDGPFVPVSSQSGNNVGQSFKQISAGLDEYGHAMCWAIANGTANLWAWKSSVTTYGDGTTKTFWYFMAPADGQCLQISATRNDDCYAIGFDHALWLKDQNWQWHGLYYTTDAGGYVQLSAGVDQHSQDEVYCLTGANHVMVVHQDRSFSWLPISASQISAGIGPDWYGIDLYYINAADRSLHWYNGTRDFGYGGVCLQISASLDPWGNGECYVIGTNHDLDKHDISGWHGEGGYMTQISAAQNDMVFVVGGSNHIWAYDPNHAWASYWASLGYSNPGYVWFWWGGVSANPN
jgi:hypothetical protein